MKSTFTRFTCLQIHCIHCKQLLLLFLNVFIYDVVRTCTQLKIYYFVAAVSIAVSVWTLVAISLERYYAICRPLHSRRWQTLSHAYKTVFFLWLSSSVCMLPIATLSRLLPTTAIGNFNLIKKNNKMIHYNLLRRRLRFLIICVTPWKKYIYQQTWAYSYNFQYKTINLNALFSKCQL